MLRRVVSLTATATVQQRLGSRQMRLNNIRRAKKNNKNDTNEKTTKKFAPIRINQNGRRQRAYLYEKYETCLETDASVRGKDEKTARCACIKHFRQRRPKSAK